MNTNEIIKSKGHNTAEIIEYMEHSVVTKMILNKTTGNICAMSFDSGEGLMLKTIPFDTFVQIIEGECEFVINNITYPLQTGQSIVIPTHTPNYINPNGRFKMILTVIKSGYE